MTFQGRVGWRLSVRMPVLS